jgi:hypothetical protein
MMKEYGGGGDNNNNKIFYGCSYAIMMVMT